MNVKILKWSYNIILPPQLYSQFGGGWKVMGVSKTYIMVLLNVFQNIEEQIFYNKISWFKCSNSNYFQVSFHHLLSLSDFFLIYFVKITREKGKLILKNHSFLCWATYGFHLFMSTTYVLYFSHLYSVSITNILLGLWG